MRAYVTQRPPSAANNRHVFARERVASTTAEILQTPLIGNSPLVGTFEESRGFGAMFTRRGLGRLKERLPFAASFVDECTSIRSHRQLWTWDERLLRRLARGQPNAFYLNVLLIPPGKAVGSHVDATLRARARVDNAVPLLVSVLYLQVPAPSTAGGGDLILLNGDSEVARITPEPGLLLHFRGALAHRIEAIADAAEVPRISMICEQYVFDPSAVGRIPDFALKSQGLFAERLKAAAQRPPPEWLVEGIER